MKYAIWPAIVIFMVAMAGCTSIPAETVQLSQAVGGMIQKAKLAHLHTVENHFDQMAVLAERFAMNEYRTAFLENVRTIMKRENPDFRELTQEQYERAMNRVFAIKSGWLKDIWDNKNTIMAQIEQLYTQMAEAHGEVTNLLRSAAGLEKTRTQAISELKSAFDLASQKLQDKVDNSTGVINKTMNDAYQKILGN